MSKSKKLNQNKFVTLMTYIVLLFFLVFTMLPFFVIIIASLTPRVEYHLVEEFIALPTKLSFEGFVFFNLILFSNRFVVFLS